MSSGPERPRSGGSPPQRGSPGVITVVRSTAREVDAVEEQLQALASALAHPGGAVGGAQAATLRHLELFEAAVQGLEVGAREGVWSQRGPQLHVVEAADGGGPTCRLPLASTPFPRRRHLPGLGA